MARYQTFIEADEEAFAKMNTYLEEKKFKKIEVGGKPAYKRGNGILTAPMYILLENTLGGVQLQAWLKWAIAPGIYVGELGITGRVVGAIPKRKLRGFIKELEAM